MTDYLVRGFRAQLNTALDSVLRRAVCEIMMIYEGSLHDHQMELANKGEEVALLKIKLQTAETKLKEREVGGDRGAEINKTQTSRRESHQREPEAAVNLDGQTADVPEIDIEVPDDWCAPLGDEATTKRDDACPSVRLRKLLIPLHRIPVIKKEITHYALHARTLNMEKTRRKAYDAAFKLKVIRLAAEEGNRAAARTFCINESMVRRWRRQHEELTRCKKTTKAFRGKKSRWPELENVLEDWVNTQRAAGRGVSTVQIRLKANTIATEKNIEDFRGGPSWCFRFMQRKGLSIRAQTTMCQQLPPDFMEKITNFREFTQRKITKNFIGPDDIINMDEVPLTFDLPLTERHERMNFTCVLSCTASGLKLPPMVIFKRMTMPKEEFPKGIAVKANKKGWMIESLMKEWLDECYGKRPGFFFHRKKALLVLDSMRAHITDPVKAAIRTKNSIPAVIPRGTTKYLQPLDISVNRSFKVALRAQWKAWTTSREKSFTETGRMRRATFSQVCQWILTAWSSVKESTITNGFRKAGLLRDEEDSASSRADLPQEESDIESANERETECNEPILGLFNSDTEEEDFDGFSAQEDDGDSDQ